MYYYSTANKSHTADFKQATIAGQAPDKGLYFPCEIPQWSKSFINNIHRLSKAEIGYEILAPYVGGVIHKNDLQTIIEETLSFNIPLKQINENIFCLELFHGPTLAFKDLGARFLSRCLGHFSSSIGKKITVLVATSGDTGGAVADAFHNVAGTEVIILYPSGKVSPVQEKQLTTFSNNIYALEVNGDFDDCQRLVKEIFSDKELNERLFLTSANSINISRWLSQQIYYVLALAQWGEVAPPVIAVPSGNFGNICAGLLANQSGLESKHFIAACNRNDVFTRYLASGNYEPIASQPTISNAMDVGDPSNFIRVLELYQHEYKELKKHISSVAYDDASTQKTIEHIYNDYHYLLDPHTAVAYQSLDEWIQNHPNDKGIILGTAHPVKFASIVEKITGIAVEIPPQLASIMGKEKKSILVEPNVETIKETITQLVDSYL
jgi:threonine synthase